MTTPFHDIADELRAIADRLQEQGDAVALGTFTVGEPPEEDDKASAKDQAKGKTAGSSSA